VADYRCYFCRKRQDQVKKLIAGPKGVYICDDCVALCKEIIDIDKEFSGTTRPEPPQGSGGWFDRLRRMAVSLPR